VAKNQRELHRETNRLHDQLSDDDVINLTALRQLWNDLDDYANAGNSLDRPELTDFDQEIMAANTTRRRLTMFLSHLTKKL
jgi:hypothetical protein